MKSKMTLHLGVIDAPHGELGTGDLAEMLEEKYHVMETFYNMNESTINGYLTDAFESAFEAAAMGAPAGDPFHAAAAKIETRFKEALSAKEFDRKIPGVPTQASLEGTSQRFKKAKERKGKKRRSKRPGRPSFIDTGIYQSSFKSWVDDK
jgi:hypothetical protein